MHVIIRVDGVLALSLSSINGYLQAWSAYSANRLGCVECRYQIWHH